MNYTASSVFLKVPYFSNKQQAIVPALPIPPLQWHKVGLSLKLSKKLFISVTDYFGAAHSIICNWKNSILSF